MTLGSVKIDITSTGFVVTTEEKVFDGHRDGEIHVTRELALADAAKRLDAIVEEHEEAAGEKGGDADQR